MRDSGATMERADTPSATSGPRDVVACAIPDARGRLLVGLRPMHKRHGGLWEFPGGKLRAGETLAEAAARELEEELGLTAIQVSSGVVFQAMDPGSNFRILFVRVDTQQAPQALEHDALEWLDVSSGAGTQGRLESLAPVDRAFVMGLQSGAVTL